MGDPASVLAKLDHPVRLAIVNRLVRPREGDETITRRGEVMAITSPKQVADDIKVPIGVVSYHFRRLTELGLLRLVRKVPRRGAVAHYYARGDLLERGRLRVLDQEWLALPDALRQAFALAAVRELAERASAGLVSTEQEDPLACGWDSVLDECAAMWEDIEASRHRSQRWNRSR